MAISARNCPEWCIAFLAAACIGAVAVPLNSLWRSAETAYALNDSGAIVLVADEQRAAYAREGGWKGRILLTKQVAQLAPAMSLPSYPPGRSIDDIAAIFYTSGSTGNPKGVCQTHRGICDQIYFTLAAQKLGVLPVSKVQGAMVLPVPLFHVTGSHHIFLTTLALGNRLILMRKWDALEALKIIHKERPSQWMGVPTMVADMMNHPKFDQFDTSSLSKLGGGGGPTPTSQIGKVKKKFKGKDAGASNGYGLTETNGAICSIAKGEYRRRPRSCGLPFPVAEVIVVEKRENRFEELPAGSRGELLIRSSLVMQSYWNKPDRTDDTIVSVEGRGAGGFAAVILRR